MLHGIGCWSTITILDERKLLSTLLREWRAHESDARGHIVLTRIPDAAVWPRLKRRSHVDELTAGSTTGDGALVGRTRSERVRRWLIVDVHKDCSRVGLAG